MSLFSFIDVAIIGGGPAGLTAAATLARQLHTAVVFDSGSYRNANVKKMHMVCGWEGRNPADFRRQTRDDILANYETIQFQDVEVTTIDKKSQSHFHVTDARGAGYDFRKILLAVGTQDNYPDIKGYAELWPSKIFHCLFCKGYEDRDAPSAGVLAVFPIVDVAMILHVAENAAQLSRHVVVYTNANSDVTNKLNDFPQKFFEIEPREIQSLESNGDSVTVTFTKGPCREEKFLVHNPLPSVKGSFVKQLGLNITQTMDIEADAPMYETTSRGVFAAGDCITPYKVIPGAMSSGCNAAVAVAAQIQSEKLGLSPSS